MSSALLLCSVSQYTAHIIDIPLSLQVAQADYEKINEFAEAAVLVRNPGKEREIKEQRRRLTDQ